ncbi:outer membrane lipoprotein-sorting protein [Novosphingobium sp. SG751A]|uniref:LolA family protein n=1 Tax=Novosphingobium sp. SG751A TaxID=2587000 RepID=UPI0020A646FA|nr:outer-membrane lipoprotein carrier protein LolA [Novosphingobium sp. SG751A]NOW45639.1 outer membrane lipoprotein-sorting protein [Novosphingobium sp. SG751A]
MLRLAMGLLVAGPAALSLVAPTPVMANAGGAGGSAAHASTQVDQAVAALRGIETLRANFVQRSDSTGQQVSGVLSLKRPGKIRFQYQRGYPVLIISDGKALTIVDSEVKQTQRWPIGKSPMGALLNPAKDVAQYGTLLPSLDPNVTNIRVTDRGHPEYGVMTLSFAHKAGAPGGLELVGWQTMDAQNRRTTIILSGHQYGVDLGDDLFKYLDIRPNFRR